MFSISRVQWLQVAAVALRLFATVRESWAGPPQADPRAQEAVAAFTAAWKPHEGYMRPRDDTGWRARLAALKRLAELGADAVPALEAALRSDDVELRVFAAQALAVLADPASEPALRQSLLDSEAAVRLYAVDALSMLGRVEHAEPIQKMCEKDPNQDVRAHVRFALARDVPPQPAAIREVLLDYDLERADSARLGKPAPDFTLRDTFGTTYQLSQFASKKPVVLIFIYGDT